MTPVTETQERPPLSQPISPPTKPMQYRAIGLLFGKYVPSAEEIAKGVLLTSDGTTIDTVVKGKVLGLVKSILDLEKEHLWVVYPKTPKLESEIPLHVQLAGIWEPQLLHPEVATEEDLQYKADDFSVQGEVVFQDFQKGSVMVKIVQAPVKKDDVPKYFKLKLCGYLPPKSVKAFWEFSVRRVGTDLVIQSAENIASLAPKNKPQGGKKQFNKKPKDKNRKYRPNSGAPKKPPSKESAVPKPMPKKRNSQANESAK